MADDPAADAMVTVATLISRVEALVVASMLEAAGILVHVGGAGHASIEVNSLALNGHRLWVPASQHFAASEVLREVLGNETWGYSDGLRKAIWRVLAIWAVPSVGFFAIGLWFSALTALDAILLPLAVVTMPVNPQARGDYYLRNAEGRTYRA